MLLLWIESERMGYREGSSCLVIEIFRIIQPQRRRFRIVIYISMMYFVIEADMNE